MSGPPRVLMSPRNTATIELWDGDRPGEGVQRWLEVSWSPHGLHVDLWEPGDVEGWPELGHEINTPAVRERISDLLHTELWELGIEGPPAHGVVGRLFVLLNEASAGQVKPP